MNYEILGVKQQYVVGNETLSKRSFLTLDAVLSYIEENQIDRKDIFGIFQEEDCKQYGQPVYRYDFVYYEKLHTH